MKQQTLGKFWTCGAISAVLWLGALPATGQVFDVNKVGYVNASFKAGFTFFSPPLRMDAEDDAVVGAIFDWQTTPDGAVLYKYDAETREFLVNIFSNGVWDDPSMTVAAGEGAILYSPETFQHTWVGEIDTGHLEKEIPVGFSLQGGMIPVAGELVEDLGFPIEELDAVYRFDREQQIYVVSTWYEGRWYGPVPIISIGESFWVQKGQSAVWTVDFELNP